ncbi:small ribosomal subunit protein bS1m-like [Bidens hawaiensis]|uniref:small ribosomal subunit protein bS1m-like n=1 Tax=Bidens hawaiensis TaxID=980011 RepID=UPI00404946E4
MTVYMSRLFRKSNSSFLLNSGKALTADVSRIRDDMFLVDAGIGTPKMTTPDELTNIPNDVTKFQNKVAFMEPTAAETLIKTQMLERMFMDLVAGEPDMKERAVSRFNDMVGSTDAVAGEPAVLLPRRFMQNQAWTELKKMWQLNKKVRGFPLEKVKGGYAVGIAGYIAFLPYRAAMMERRKLANYRFTIETFVSNSKRKKITVF